MSEKGKASGVMALYAATAFVSAYNFVALKHVREEA